MTSRSRGGQPAGPHRFLAPTDRHKLEVHLLHESLSHLHGGDPVLHVDVHDLYG